MAGLFSSLASQAAQSRGEDSALPTHPATEGRIQVAALDGEGLLKSFGQGETKTLAVQDVSISLCHKELALLMGPSGSGKSTLLAMISGLLRPDEGQVQALGQNIWQHSKAQMERFRLKY